MSTHPAPRVDPEGFYQVAQNLVALGPDERNLRSAISRAYYACFHLARLGGQRKRSWSPPEYELHRAVVRKLREQHQTFLARELLALLDLRERADYDLDARVDEAMAGEALKIATALLPRLRSL